MTPRLADPRRKASLALAFIFVAGVVVGVAVGRIWAGRLPGSAFATPLTVEALADSLRLDSAQRARVRQVVDSLDAAIAQASEQGPESLQVMAASARRRLEEALPSDRRTEFQTWMESHRARMMRMMGGQGMMRSMMGPATRQGGGGMMEPGARPGRGASAERGMRQGGGMMGRGMMGGMMQRMMGSQPLPAVPAESLPEPGSRGAQLVASYCGRCHGIPDPRIHRAAEWPGVVERMLQNMRSSGVAAPDSSETRAIVAYLLAHARL